MHGCCPCLVVDHDVQAVEYVPHGVHLVVWDADARVGAFGIDAVADIGVVDGPFAGRVVVAGDQPVVAHAAVVFQPGFHQDWYAGADQAAQPIEIAVDPHRRVEALRAGIGGYLIRAHVFVVFVGFEHLGGLCLGHRQAVVAQVHGQSRRPAVVPGLPIVLNAAEQ